MDRRSTFALAAAATLAACGPAALGPDLASSAVSKTVVPLPPPPPPQPTEYSGRATAVSATVKVLFSSITTRLGDTGPLPSTGGSLQAALATATIPGLLSAGVATGNTAGADNDAHSESSVANLSLTAGGIGISAAILASQTDANCFSGAPTMAGSSTIAGLVIAGQAIDVTGAPNQAITLLGGLVRIVINEQSQTGDSIDVNALHVTVAGAADVVVAKTHSDITCGR